ncbi:MAG: polysaccharide pyruvyl transferase family protein [Candidatus Aminicenantaceae bacterium]
MKIIIINTHSVLNSGDAGIVLAQIQFLKKSFRNLEITLTSRTPLVDKVFYNERGIKVFPPLIPTTGIYSQKAEKFFGVLKDIINLKPKIKLIKEFKICDVVISSGGGYFYSNKRIFPSLTFFQNYFHIKMASIFKKPVILFPQSFGPFHNKLSQWLMKRLLEMRNLIKIFVRDEISLQLLKRMKEQQSNKYEMCPDMAFYYCQENNVHNFSSFSKLPKPLIVFTLRQWSFPEAQSIKKRKMLKENYLQTLKKTGEKIYHALGGSVLILPQARGPEDFENDRIISRQLFEGLKKVIPRDNLLYVDLPDTAPPSEIIHVISQASLVVATRFHSAIFALISEIPVISIAYQHKSTGIMRMLGLDHFSLNILNLESSDILELIEDILNQDYLLRNQIEKKIIQIKKTIDPKLINAMNLIRSFDKRK